MSFLVNKKTNMLLHILVPLNWRRTSPYSLCVCWLNENHNLLYLFSKLGEKSHLNYISAPENTAFSTIYPHLFIPIYLGSSVYSRIWKSRGFFNEKRAFYLKFDKISNITKPTNWSWASAQSDPHKGRIDPKATYCIKFTVKTDQTGWMPILIWVVAGNTLICWVYYIAANIFSSFL